MQPWLTWGVLGLWDEAATWRAVVASAVERTAGPAAGFHHGYLPFAYAACCWAWQDPCLAKASAADYLDSLYPVARVLRSAQLRKQAACLGFVLAGERDLSFETAASWPGWQAAC